MDPDREIRSMVMCCLPAPPMPMLVSRCVEDETSFVHTEGVGNSHDLIAHLMGLAGRAQNGAGKIHESRMEKQKLAFKKLLDCIDVVKSDPRSINYYYGAMAEFTRSYITSYLSNDANSYDIRFLPPSEVHRGSTIHRATMDFVKAQDIISQREAPTPVELMTYPEIVYMLARRLESEEE